MFYISQTKLEINYPCFFEASVIFQRAEKKQEAERGSNEQFKHIQQTF